MNDCHHKFRVDLDRDGLSCACCGLFVERPPGHESEIPKVVFVIFGMLLGWWMGSGG